MMVMGANIKLLHRNEEWSLSAWSNMGLPTISYPYIFHRKILLGEFMKNWGETIFSN